MLPIVFLEPNYIKLSTDALKCLSQTGSWRISWVTVVHVNYKWKIFHNSCKGNVRTANIHSSS